MKFKILTFFLLMALFCTIGCKKETNQNTKETINQTDNHEQEKSAILEVLNSETKAAYNRD